MGNYDRKDRFYKKAKDEGRVSRSSYKIEQIQQRYKLFKKGDRVLDVGAAPGGWSDVVAKLVGEKGLVFGIDLLPLKIQMRPNIRFLQSDIYDEKTISAIKSELGQADVIMSDIAPDTSGVKFRDSFLSYEMVVRTLEIAEQFLKQGGNFVAKIFPGEEFAELKKDMQKKFERVDQYRPAATRDTSIEVYLVGIKYKKADH